jgi:hypothetical protein
VFPDISSLDQLTVLDLTSNANLTGVLTLPELPRETVIVGPEESQEEFSPNVIIAVSIILFILFIVCGVLAYIYYIQPIHKARRQRARDDDKGSSDVEAGRAFGEEGDQRSPTPMNPTPIRMALFGSKKLRVTKLLSKGGFGYVYKGVYEERDVAVKRIIAPLKKKDKLRLAKMFRTSLLH